MRMIAGKLVATAGALLLATAALAHDTNRHGPAGEPGDPKRPARKIAVTASDAGGQMRFAPQRIEVAKGDQILFAITNAGVLAHEFVIGSRSENAAHARMMAEMPGMTHNDPNAVTVAPGQSASLLWRFSSGGAFEYACLIPGHYEAGMHGSVSVK